MGKNTLIAWATDTFNPWWGCVEVSPACKFCYARTFSKRVGFDLWGQSKPRRFFSEKHWLEPLKWNVEAAESGVKRRVFCASMADVFEDHRDLDIWREKLWRLIERTDHLIWLLLTKRPECALRMLPWKKCPKNVWFGVTMEDQEWLDKRLPAFKEVQADTKFVSIEPMLGEMDLSPLKDVAKWVIVGEESGHGSRPTDHDWVRKARDWCLSNGVSFFLKQMVQDRKMVSTPVFDGKVWTEVPYAGHVQVQ